MPKPNQKNISEAAFYKLTSKLHDLEISEVWRGYGTAIFIEIGRLHEKRYTIKGKERTYMSGDYTISVEWSWRVEGLRSIRFGSWSTDRIITNRLKALQGKTVQNISLFGRIPELQISISDGSWLTSYMTSEGQPVWGITFSDCSVFIDRGQLVSEARYEKRQKAEQIVAANRLPAVS